MITIEEIIVRNIVAHKVNSDDKLTVFASKEFTCDNLEEEKAIKTLLLKPFQSQIDTYEFNHEVNIDYNVLFNISKSIFENNNFIENSIDIAKFLLSISKHFNINDGELFIAKLESIKFDNSYYEGLGIYKFDNKETYIESNVVNSDFQINFRRGIGSKKPDKGCLIIYTNKPYTILVIDNNETDYWRNEFIKLKSKNDSVKNTKDFLTITKNYVTNQLEQDFEVDKTDKIDLLNRSVEYFKKKEIFDKAEFEADVFQDKNLIESFRSFNDQYQKEHDLDLEDTFDISAQAVKKQAKVFKSVLKLDKNFHIYIHGNKDLIEKGIDENGKKYYKIFYDSEA